MKYSLIISLLILGACASKKPEKKPVIYPSTSPEVTTTNPKETSITAKQLASEQGSNFVTEIKFSKGHTDISSNDQLKIKELYEKANAKGKVSEVQLITWADKEFPVKGKSDLAGSQLELVNDRNEQLEKVIVKLDDDLEVKKISMAERAGALAKFTASKESQVKESLDNKEAAGKTSEAMVIFILKD